MSEGYHYAFATRREESNGRHGPDWTFQSRRELSKAEYDRLRMAHVKLMEFERSKDIVRAVDYNLEHVRGVMRDHALYAESRSKTHNPYLFLFDLNVGLLNLSSSFYVFCEHQNASLKRLFGRKSREEDIWRKQLGAIRSEFPIIIVMDSLRHYCVHKDMPPLDIAPWQITEHGAAGSSVFIARAPLLEFVARDHEKRVALQKMAESIDLQNALDDWKSAFELLWRTSLDLRSLSVEADANILLKLLSQDHPGTTRTPILVHFENAGDASGTKMDYAQLLPDLIVQIVNVTADVRSRVQTEGTYRSKQT